MAGFGIWDIFDRVNYNVQIKVHIERQTVNTSHAMTAWQRKFLTALNVSRFLVNTLTFSETTLFTAVVRFHSLTTFNVAFAKDLNCCHRYK